MKSLFNLDSPFMQLLTRVGDLILVNCLFLICSIPIVTMGAAIAGLHKVTQDQVTEKDPSIFRTFFRGFRENFKQATIAWLFMLVFFAAMACNLFLIMGFLTGAMATLCNAIVLVLSVLVLSIGAYLFPLMVRYENSLRELARNSGILAIVKLPKTLLMVFLNALPVLIAYVSMQVFINTLVFWLVIGFGFVSYVTTSLLMPIFKEMEGENGPNMKLMV